MKKLTTTFIILLLLIASNSIFSQIPIKFRKAIGSSGYDEGYSAKQTFDKGYIIGGSTSSFGNGATDMYLLKTNEYGIPKRQAMFGGINVDVAKCVRQTADSGYVLLGYTNSYGAGGYDVYLVKTDSLMDTLWTRTYGGVDWDFGNCIEPTTDGGYIVCGYTYSYGNGDADYYLLKLNAAGDTVWTKTYGGTNEDQATSVVQTSDGGYILTGTSKSMGDVLGDMYTIKTDALGNVVWTNLFGGATHLDYSNDILISRNGGYLLAGESQSFGSGDSDGIIVKIDINGVTVGLMYRTYLPAYDGFQSITEDTLGRVAATGREVTHGDPNGNGDGCIYILNSNWTYFNGTSFGGGNYDEGFSIETATDNGFIICGITQSFSNYLDDVYLIKTDSMGYCTSTDVSVATNIQNTHVTNNTSMSIFPNPANDYVKVMMNKSEKGLVLKITDLLGNEIKTEKVIHPNSNTINVSDLTNGIYFITLSGNEYSHTEKLVIQH